MIIVKYIQSVYIYTNIYKVYAKWRIREKRYKNEQLSCPWEPHNRLFPIMYSLIGHRAHSLC